MDLPRTRRTALALVCGLVFIISPSIAQGFPNTTAAVWPMSANYSSSDLNKTLHGILQQVRFGDGPTGFQQTSMQFNGMMGTYASFTNEAPALDVGLGSFTVATHVWLDSSREGLVLCWSGLKTFPNGLKIYIVQETLHVDLYSRDRGLEYGQLLKTFTFLRVTEKEWNFIGVAFDKATNTITMIINDLRRDIHLPKDFNFGVSGIETRGGIFFGGHPKLNSPRPMQGRMSCSLLFRAVVSVTELQQARSECMAVLHGKISSGSPLGIWPLTNEYSASDLSGYNLHGQMKQYMYSDGPEGRKRGATTLDNQTSIDIHNTFQTLAFNYEISFFAHVYFEKLDDCDINSWHGMVNNTVGPITSGPQLVIRSGTVNVKLDVGHYVTDICVSYARSGSANVKKPGNTSSCNDRLHVAKFKWHFIGYTYSAADGIFTIWVDRVAVRYRIGKLPVLTTGAVLRLAGLKEDGTTKIVTPTAFHGRLAWVYIMARGIPVQEAYTIHEKTYRKHVLETKPFTPVTFWPLDMTTGLWDISDYNMPGKVHGFKYAEGPSFEKNTAVSFDGTSKSYLEVLSRDYNLDLKSTIGVFAFVRQAAAADATIVEWQGDANMTNGIQLCIKNGYVTVNLVRRGERRQSNYFQGFQVVHGVWSFIGFTYDAADGLLLIWKDDQHPVIKNVGQFQIETRGAVYVGGRPNTTEKQYRGDLACFSVYGAMMQKNEVMYVRRNCQQRMYIFKSPTGLYPLSKAYMAADLAGYGNNGNPQNVAFGFGPDSTPDRATYFLPNQASKINIVNYDRQLDLDRQITLTVFIYADDKASKNSTIVEWDGIAYSTKGLGFLIKNSRLTASVYPKEFALDALTVAPNTWYMVGMTYHYYHATLQLWAQKFGESRLYMAEKLVYPQLLSTRGNLLVGASSTIIGSPFSGRMACLMIYSRALSMTDGMAESKKCFGAYLTIKPTAGTILPTHGHGGQAHDSSQGALPHPGQSAARHNNLLVPIVIVVTLAVLLVIAVVFITRRRQRADRDRYRHTRLMDGADENGYAEYHDSDDWEDDQRDSHSLMNMGNVKRYNIVGTV